MNIIGNGVDIIKNKRIERSLKINGFKNRIFTKNEILQSKKLKIKQIFLQRDLLPKKLLLNL